MQRRRVQRSYRQAVSGGRTDSYAHTDSDPDCYRHGYSYTHGHSYTDSDRYSDSNTHGHSYTDSDRYGDCHLNANRDRYGDCHLNANRHGYTSSHGSRQTLGAEGREDQFRGRCGGGAGELG